MIDRKVLSDLGFEKSGKERGWDGEVWVYDGEFWVHFEGKFIGLPGQQISGDDTMVNFFKMFIANIKEECKSSAYVSFHDHK